MTHARELNDLPPVLADVAAAALGRTHRLDPVLPRTGGPAGNARLTAWTGLLLLALFLAELVTLLDVRGLLSWHVVIGTLLLPPALLKTATTGWRIGRYYRRDPAYQQAGPPPLLLRLLGPGVIVSTLGLIGSGLLLILLGRDTSRSVLLSALGHQIDWVTIHQGMFLIWGVLTGLHVLTRIVPALRLTVLRGSEHAESVPGGRGRLTTLVATVAAAVVAAALVLAGAGSWQSDTGRNDDGHRSASSGRP